jgi:hypothetical protein
MKIRGAITIRAGLQKMMFASLRAVMPPGQGEFAGQLFGDITAGVFLYGGLLFIRRKCPGQKTS